MVLCCAVLCCAVLCCAVTTLCRCLLLLQGEEKSVVARHEVGHALVSTGERAVLASTGATPQCMP